jgi:hypothetical protein
MNKYDISLWNFLRGVKWHPKRREIQIYCANECPIVCTLFDDLVFKKLIFKPLKLMTKWYYSILGLPKINHDSDQPKSCAKTTFMDTGEVFKIWVSFISHFCNYCVHTMFRINNSICEHLNNLAKLGDGRS